MSIPDEHSGDRSRAYEGQDGARADVFVAQPPEPLPGEWAPASEMSGNEAPVISAPPLKASAARTYVAPPLLLFLVGTAAAGAVGYHWLDRMSTTGRAGLAQSSSPEANAAPFPLRAAWRDLPPAAATPKRQTPVVSVLDQEDRAQPGATAGKLPGPTRAPTAAELLAERMSGGGMAAPQRGPAKEAAKEQPVVVAPDRPAVAEGPAPKNAAPQAVPTPPVPRASLQPPPVAAQPPQPAASPVPAIAATRAPGMTGLGGPPPSEAFGHERAGAMPPSQRKPPLVHADRTRQDAALPPSDHRRAAPGASRKPVPRVVRVQPRKPLRRIIGGPPQGAPADTLPPVQGMSIFNGLTRTMP